jgi:hypothetical protein
MILKRPDDILDEDGDVVELFAKPTSSKYEHTKDERLFAQLMDIKQTWEDLLGI